MNDIKSLKRRTFLISVILFTLISSLLYLDRAKVLVNKKKALVNYELRGKKIFMIYNEKEVGYLNLEPYLNGRPVFLGNFIHTTTGYKANIIDFNGEVILNLKEGGFLYWVNSHDERLKSMVYFPKSNLELHSINLFSDKDASSPIYDIHRKEGFKLLIKNSINSKDGSSNAFVLKTNPTRDEMYGRISIILLEDSFSKVDVSYKDNELKFNFENLYANNQKKMWPFPVVGVFTDLDYDSDVLTLLKNAEDRYFGSTKN